jgi:DNA-binding MarR family transcriptional regulator
LLLWRVTLRWQRQITATLKPFGLTHVQFVLLASTWWLSRTDDRTPNQRDLAQHAVVDVMMASQVLRALEAKGLVRRERDPRDARAVQVTITEAGAELAVRAVRAVEAADAEFFGAAPDQAALVEALRTLSE